MASSQINFGDQIVISAALAVAVRKAKNSSWFPLVAQAEEHIIKFVHAVVALAASVGIIVTASHLGPGHWGLDVQGLTLMGVMQFAWAWGKNYVLLRGMDYLQPKGGNNGNKNQAPAMPGPVAGPAPGR